MNQTFEYAQKIGAKCKALGISDFGFADVSAIEYCRDIHMPFAVSLVVKLSDAIIEEIGTEPTFAYFQHYRAVNALIDSFELQIGMLIEAMGYRYFPIAASQSIPTRSRYSGLVSHKAVARLAGLGSIGKSALFLSSKFGPRVRLGTVLTDLPLPAQRVEKNADVCGNCEICVHACPAMAIKGTVWQEGTPRSEIVDAQACSQYMKQHFQHIGRGSVCGLCMKACRYRGEKNSDRHHR